MTHLDLHRLLESIQCITCPECNIFKQHTGIRIALIVCGRCRGFLTTCARHALAHACSHHHGMHFHNPEELARNFHVIYVVHSFELQFHPPT